MSVQKSHCIEGSFQISCYRLADQAFVERLHHGEQFDAAAVLAHREIKGSDAELVDYCAGDLGADVFDHAYS